MNEMIKSILVFDICSSTTIIDLLHSVSSVDSYFSLMEGIGLFLNKESRELKYEVYKFIGDGFVLVFDENVEIDTILYYTIRLTTRCDEEIDNFISIHLPNRSIPRTGITCGLDRGWLETGVVMEGREYIGKPINVACRLQGSLSKKEHINKLMMTNAVKERIKNRDLKIASHRMMRKLRNLDDKEMPYYEFDPLAFDSQKRSNSREAIKRILVKEGKADNQFEKRFKEIYKQSSATSVIEFINWLNEK